MPQHHSVFSKFPFPKPIMREGFAANCVGAQFNLGFYIPGTEPKSSGTNNLPDFDSEYFEWLDVLESVANSNGTYRIVELGAGFGRWTAIAVAAARLLKTEDIRTYSAEAEPTHADWMRQVFADNNMNDERFKILEAAVGPEKSVMPFYVVPSTGTGLKGPKDWYGQAFAVGRTEAPEERAENLYHGKQVKYYSDGSGVIDVPVIPLNDIIKDETKVDLVDMDIQGAEADVISSSIETLNQKVKRLHIGTHSREIDAKLIEILSNAGWRNLRTYLCLSEQETPYGKLSFQDGVQSWENPKFD